MSLLTEIVAGKVTVRSGMQPDTLKLSSQLAILKLVHRTAFTLDHSLGDKSSGKNYYLRGIQGQVSSPVWNRDYFYLNGKVQEVCITRLTLCFAPLA